jgi:drug/metabolite transporter (DMT)-like permease
MRPVNAILLLVLSAVGFGAMALLSKLACRTYDGATVAGVRFAIGAIVIGALWATGRVDARPRHHRLLWVRGLSGGVAVVLYFMAMQTLSVGLATLLNYTSPVFAVFIARASLGERLTWRAGAALALATAGVTVVVLGQGTDALHAAPDPLWVGLALLSSVFSAAAVVTVRALRSQPEPETVWSIYFAFCVTGVLCALPVSRGLHWPSPTEAALLLGVGVTSMFAQLSMNAVMRWVPAALFGVIAQLAVVCAMLLGVWVLDEPWTLTSALGAGVTLIGVLLAAWAHQSRPSEARPTATVTASASRSCDGPDSSRGR